ncbi:hypothetical protein GUJ93_ZPchr0013g36033 [Zizania palustris]|uniref:Uncharacterized protein n=1 Tax=Zizania palustris TaxID=103762 RepID=A0A8J6C6E8_ZIZPA|nr:hypothetical protein GUJ93_ZPchr0013g36033 [Zizania palustris]
MCHGSMRSVHPTVPDATCYFQKIPSEIARAHGYERQDATHGASTKSQESGFPRPHAGSALGTSITTHCAQSGQEAISIQGAIKHPGGQATIFLRRIEPERKNRG